MSELISVVLPVYNESDCIIETIDNVESVLTKANMDFEIIVVDDGSTDNSADLASQKNVKVLRHRKNFGVGAARKTGIKAAKGSLIFMTDVDGTYPIDEMPRFIKHLLEKDVDMVVGARKGKNVVFEWPHRSIPKFFIRALASYISQSWIPDLNSGFRVFKKDFSLQYFYLLPDSHSWVSTITIAFLTNNQSVAYLNIDYFKRKGGRSSFSPLRDTYNYVSLVIRTSMYFKPLRLFIPTSISLLTISVIKSIYDWQVYRSIGSVDVMLFLGGLFVILIGLLADLVVVSSRRLGS